MRRAAILAPALLAVSANSPATTTVSVTVNGLRSAKGVIRACLISKAKAFPDCSKDPASRGVTVPAANGAVIEFTGIAAGTYAVSLLHDENGNGRMDKFLMIPTEGYGFSRDAPVRFGPPSFGQASFAVGAEAVRTTIRMRYL